MRPPRFSCAQPCLVLSAALVPILLAPNANAANSAIQRRTAELAKFEQRCDKVMADFRERVAEARKASDLRDAESAFKQLRKSPTVWRDWGYYCLDQTVKYSGKDAKQLVRLDAAHNKKMAKVRAKHEQEIESTRLKVIPALAAVALKAGDALAARWMLYDAWNWDGENANPSLEKLLGKIEKAYAVTLTKQYNSSGGYGMRGSKRGCVVSSKKFPKNLKKANASAFSGLIKGGGKLYVVCALDRKANEFNDGIKPRLAIRILQSMNDDATELARVVVGPAKKLGNTEWIRAEFDLPPKGVHPKRRRAVMRVDAIQVYNKPLEKLPVYDAANRSNRWFWLR